MKASVWSGDRDLSPLESLPLQEFDRLETHRERRREPYEALSEAVVYAFSVATLAIGVAVVHHLLTHVSMIL